VRVTERVDLEYVGEPEERLEVDASSKVGNGENEDGGIVSLGRCPSPLEDPARDGVGALVEGLGVGT
jgi:hypothetical protein